MPKYNYACNKCGHDYSETRAEDHPQWYTNCPVANCEGSLVEVK